MLLLLCIFLWVAMPLCGGKGGGAKGAFADAPVILGSPKGSTSKAGLPPKALTEPFIDSSRAGSLDRARQSGQPAKDFFDVPPVQLSQTKAPARAIPDKKNEGIVSEVTGGYSRRDGEAYADILNPNKKNKSELNSVAVMMLQVAKKRGRELQGETGFEEQSKAIDRAIDNVSVPDIFSEKAKGATRVAVSKFGLERGVSFTGEPREFEQELSGFSEGRLPSTYGKQRYEVELETLDKEYQKVVQKIKKLDPKSKLPDTLLIYAPERTLAEQKYGQAIREKPIKSQIKKNTEKSSAIIFEKPAQIPDKKRIW